MAKAKPVTMLPDPESASDAPEALSGEVITPEDVARLNRLNEQEAIIADAVDLAQRATAYLQGQAARALNIIRWEGLWRARLNDTTGKPFTSFTAYATSTLGWLKTQGRLSQIMSADLPAYIEAEGDKAPAEAVKAAAKVGRKNAVTDIDLADAAATTLRQIDKVMVAWGERNARVTGDETSLMERTYAETQMALSASLAGLRELLAEADDAEADDDDTEADDAEGEDAE